MSLEAAILELAAAIRTLGTPHVKPTAPKRPLEPRCMDQAGAPTSFKNKCGICGEVGRNARSHRDEMQDGTFHWIEVKP